MTVDDLIEVLQLYVDNGHGDYKVIKSSDDEGNSFTQVNELQQTNMRKTKYGIELISDEELDDYKCDKVVCIW